VSGVRGLSGSGGDRWMVWWLWARELRQLVAADTPTHQQYTCCDTAGELPDSPRCEVTSLALSRQRTKSPVPADAVQH